MSASFRKGDLVTLFSDYDRHGTVLVRDLTVYSCGAKRMILVNDAGEKFAGTWFRSGAESLWESVQPRMSAAAADAFALDMGAKIVVAERALLTTRLDSAAFHHPAVHRELAALHEPRVLRRP